MFTIVAGVVAGCSCCCCQGVELDGDQYVIGVFFAAVTDCSAGMPIIHCYCMLLFMRSEVDFVLSSSDVTVLSSPLCYSSFPSITCPIFRTPEIGVLCRTIYVETFTCGHWYDTGRVFAGSSSRCICRVEHVSDRYVSVSVCRQWLHAPTHDVRSCQLCPRVSAGMTVW